jgi:Flp pilus assembly protein TadD
VLLDQKRTKRMVKIVSIICAVAFVGVLPVVLGLVVFGGGSSHGNDQLIEEAEARVEAAPTDIQALVDLAAQYRASGRDQDATTTIQRAIAVGPADGEDLQALVSGLSGNAGQQLQVLETYTKANPNDAEAFFTYGQTAEAAGQLLTARLAYQRAAQKAKAGTTLRSNAQAALERLRNTPVPTTPVAPATPATPATP